MTKRGEPLRSTSGSPAAPFRSAIRHSRPWRASRSIAEGHWRDDCHSVRWCFQEARQDRDRPRSTDEAECQVRSHVRVRLRYLRCLRGFVYDSNSFLAIFRVPLWSGLAVFLFELPFAVPKDEGQHVELMGDTGIFRRFEISGG
jgi:hypothetical protein